MRNLDECKAEVFRRSEERIRKRKKTQKYMLALGSTFAFCATVCSVLVVSGILNMGYETAEKDNQMLWEDEIPNTDNIQDTNDMPNSDVQDVLESTGCLYVQVDVETYGESHMNSHTVTDETQVAGLFEMIQNIFDNEDAVLREESPDFETIMYQNGNQDDSNDLSGGSSFKNMEYVIRFKTSNETYQIYLLNRGVLLDFTKKKALVLTGEELLDLKTAIAMEE